MSVCCYSGYLPQTLAWSQPQSGCSPSQYIYRGPLFPLESEWCLRVLHPRVRPPGERCESFSRARLQMASLGSKGVRPAAHRCAPQWLLPALRFTCFRCTDCWQSNKLVMIADHRNIITDWPLLYVYRPFMFLLISAVCPYNLSFPYKSVCSFCRLCNIPFVGCMDCKRLFLSSKVCFFVFFYFAYEWFYLVKAFSISVFWYVYFFFYSFSFFISLSWYQQYIFCMLYS